MHSEYRRTVKGFMGRPMDQKMAPTTSARHKWMPWSRKKVVSALESGLIVSLSVSGSPLFFISRSAVNSPSTSHLIVTIPNRQFASVWNRSGDSARVVGKPDVIQVGPIGNDKSMRRRLGNVVPGG